MQTLHGDCAEILKTIPDNSIDACVCDPPYGLSFMGKKWDYEVPSVDVWREVLRVLKPGAHVVSFGGTRTYHRLAVAIEDAGFEIRDQLQWLYGSGFPKSLDISKAIDKAAGARREVIGKSPSARPNHGNNENLVAINQLTGDCVLTKPATDSAKQWQGWGTALKPANEPIVLARKPLSEKTVALNVQKWGVGGLNIDGCRIAHDAGVDMNMRQRGSENRAQVGDFGINKGAQDLAMYKPGGRWPANLLLDEEAAAMLDEQVKGKLHAAGNKKPAKMNKSIWESGKGFEKEINFKDFDGGASRFFYVAKASKSERNRGLEGMPKQVLATTTGQTRPNKPARLGADPHAVQEPVANHHPTVKPIKLMEYLCKLITPPGGTVLDPFMGSGTTGVACKRLGFDFIGIEMNEEYIEIAKKRIEAA